MRCPAMAPVNRLAARLRDAVHKAAEGDMRRWIPLRDIQRKLRVTDDAIGQAAARHAADEGWVQTIGGRDVHSVRLTAEGVRLGNKIRIRLEAD
ncbi:hypothetical protein FHP25_30000 [Vineibacter terrae]|uniref:DUF3253 domain-containing protein n=1 Tax=Vineibacter terrae TaxID=2586908 RepID=A0A5C8PD38_9HYPH|nr:hypothetical protein [Vineibacter terrae]TXL71464.1 hypothetical protein FHP25_30000 [Vineibacter terrae]